MSVTIHDVARRAGVSIATVSRVLNGTSPVREAKRKLVLEAADTLGYAPNPAALSLLNKQTGGLGVLLPHVGGEFFSDLLNGMDEAARDHDRFLVISTSHRRPSDFRRAVSVLDKRVDGLVVMAPEIDTAEATTILRAETPTVFVNTCVDARTKAQVVNFDNAGGTYRVTRHLLDLGHRRIAFVRGPDASWDAQERAEGYRRAMADANQTTDALEFAGGYGREAGVAAAEAILATSPRPTAIVCPNDYCAFGAMSVLHQAGVRIPEDMSVCGFDDLASARYAVPPLTTVHVPIHHIGYEAIRRLVESVDGNAGSARPVRETVPVEVVLRDSSAPPPEA